MDDIEKKKDKKGIPWHPAFVEALQATLIDYKDALEYQLEHPLNTEPLRIDILVIKKRPDVVIKRSIAEIFRLENIVEYKSPTDFLSINEFYKALARAYLYKALADVKISDLTLSFVVAAQPRKLFQHLRRALGYAVDERHPGVFAVTGAVMPIQIIDIRELSEEDNHWLRNLDRNLSGESLRQIIRLEQKHGRRINLDAYLYAVLSANQEKLKKEDFLMLTKKTIAIIEEIGWGQKWLQKGIQKGRQEGIQEGIQETQMKTARAMLADGDSLAKISRITEIPLKTLKTLQKELPAK